MQDNRVFRVIAITLLLAILGAIIYLSQIMTAPIPATTQQYKETKAIEV